MGQLSSVPQTQPPTKYLPGLEVKHDSQVVPTTLEPQVRKVLYPAARFHHASICLTGLWVQLIPKGGKPLESIRCHWYFCWGALTVTLPFAGAWNVDSSQRPDAPSFVLAPT
jgi:hypothetical protein